MKLYALPTFEVLLFCRDSTVSNCFLVRQWYVKLSMFLDKLMFYYSYNTKGNPLPCVEQTSSMLEVKVMLILCGVDANIRKMLFYCHPCFSVQTREMANIHFLYVIKTIIFIIIFLFILTCSFRVYCLFYLVHWLLCFPVVSLLMFIYLSYCGTHQHNF